MPSNYQPNTTLRDGTEVYIEACEVESSSTAFNDQGLKIGQAVFMSLDDDDENYLVTNIEVTVGYGRKGLATALIKEFALELGAGISFDNRDGVALGSGAHLTPDGKALAAELVRTGVARWLFPD